MRLNPASPLASVILVPPGKCSASRRQHDRDGEGDFPCSGDYVPGEDKEEDILQMIGSDWIYMCACGPIFAYVLISEMSV